MMSRKGNRQGKKPQLCPTCLCEVCAWLGVTFLAVVTLLMGELSLGTQQVKEGKKTPR